MAIQSTRKTRKRISRRQFLLLGAAGSGAVLLSACGANGNSSPAGDNAPAATAVPVSGEAATAEEEVIVGDVLDYALTSDEWPGEFGSVQFRLHEGRYNGQPIYYIRTDASNAEFAEANQLVHVPLLSQAASMTGMNSLYLFDDDRPGVLAAAPDDDNFISLFQIKRVAVSDSVATLDSAAAVEQAAADGQATITAEPIYVNYPVVKWPGGELPVDTERDSYLGTGQLLAPVDTENMTVTFKLHECYPGSRYIVTDTSAAPMAPMMSIPAAPLSQQLMELGGTDEIWVFANGIAGSGVMGFQPAVFDNRAGTPAWSPFWNHFTWLWVDEANARVITSAAAGREAEAAGELELFNGTPDSHPNGFVVNCPVPILAPNTFAA